MAQFLGIHGPDSIIDEAIKSEDPWQDYKAACTSHGCQALHVHYNPEMGRGFCVTEAGSPDQVQAAHTAANLRVQEIIEVQYED